MPSTRPENNFTMSTYTRRDFAKLALGALPAATVLSELSPLHAADKSRKKGGKPNSKVAGVQLGLNVPYSFKEAGTMSGEEILRRCVQLNLSAVELRTQPVEMFLGLAPELVGAKKGAAEANAPKVREWRRTASVDRAKDFRRMYEDAGVLIEIVKVDGLFKMTDAELDYVFPLAQALGGRAISTEISKSEEDLKRVGAFADKHRLMVGYHGHAATAPEHWEKAFSFAKYNAANVDIGHFVAGNNVSPVDFIKKYHARITHVHLKDRKMHEGPNTPFGEGDTPIKEVLHLIRDNRWPIQATIEFEYKVPEGSDTMKEIARALQYCRDALV
jgi:sugar phosphate isomerase/epimerase